MIRAALILLFYLFALGASSSIYATKIRIGADHWVKLVEPEGNGIYQKLLNKIYGENNIDLNIDAFNRQLKAFGDNDIDAIVGVYRGDLKNAILPKTFIDSDDPVYAFYLKGNEAITPETINQYHTSWVRGYHFERFLNKVVNSYPVNHPKHGFELLVNKRIDVFVDYDANIPPQHRDKLAKIQVIPARYLYVAFQKHKSGKILADQFDLAMQKLRQSGELAEILGERYIASNHADFKLSQQKIILISDEVDLIQDDSIYGLKSTSSLSTSINLLIENISNYSFEIDIANDFSDLATYIDSENTCFVDMIKTQDRERDFIFSNPFTLAQGLRVFSKNSLEITHAINLADLLSSRPHLTVGVVKGRSYGEEIDRVIKSLPRTQIVYIPGELSKSITMFSHSRFNLLIDFPSEVFHYWQQKNKRLIYSYGLDESPDYFVGHLMCSDTQITRSFISEFNDQIRRLVKNETLLQVQSQNISEQHNEEFTQLFKTLIED